MAAPGIAAVLLAALAVASPLPFFVSQLMPDVFTGLLALALLVLVVAPERLGRWERRGLMLVRGFRLRGASVEPADRRGAGRGPAAVAPRPGRARGAGVRGLATAVAAPVLAVAALMAANLAGHGRASIAPYGNVFLLTRVIYDGPGLDALRTRLPAPRLAPVPPGAAISRQRGPVPVVRGRPGGARRRGQAGQPGGRRHHPRRRPGRAVAGGPRDAPQHRAAVGRCFIPATACIRGPATVTPWIDRDFPALRATRLRRLPARPGPTGPAGRPRLVA